MKFKMDRVISVATLAASVVAIVLVLKKPAPVVAPQAPAAAAQHVQAADQKSAQTEQSTQPQQTQASSGVVTLSIPSAAAQSGQAAVASAVQSPKADGLSNSSDISGAVAQLLGSAGGGLSPTSNVGNGTPAIKDQQVTMEGDVVHGKFLTEIGGKDVWVTISGHMGEKDGYATFDPTEFKVGDTNVPVALVNPMLQKKLAEERDRLKIPNGGSSQ